jgi:hypothetical protein
MHDPPISERIKGAAIGRGGEKAERDRAVAVHCADEKRIFRYALLLGIAIVCRVQICHAALRTMAPFVGREVISKG